MLFKYNSQQWFNTDCIEHVTDTGSDLVVTLKGGRECVVTDRKRFTQAIQKRETYVEVEMPIL